MMNIVYGVLASIGGKILGLLVQAALKFFTLEKSIMKDKSQVKSGVKKVMDLEAELSALNALADECSDCIEQKKKKDELEKKTVQLVSAVRDLVTKF